MKFLRHLKKNPGYALINILGLSTSMAACLLIFEYASFELSFDRGYEPNIYRVNSIFSENGVEKQRSAGCYRETAPVIRDQVPEIKDAVRMSPTWSWFDCTLAYTKNDNTIIFNENNGFWFAEQSFIKMFRVEFIDGDPGIALANPYSLVLSESSAKKYFGNDTPVGKTMRLRGSFQIHDYTVTGVMKDFPKNSHLGVDILASFNSLPPGPFDTYVYLQLHANTSEGRILSKLDKLAPQIESSRRTQLKFGLEKIESIHLYSKLEDEPKPGGNATAVYSLLGVAVLILAIAWINYVNLASSKIVSRAKEVGIYKINGASNLNNIVRYLSETMVLNIASVGVAVVFFKSIAPAFNTFIGINISNDFSLLSNLSIEVVVILVLFFAGTLMSGIVPAWALSRLSPIRVLKGKFVMRSEGISFRKAAVVFQFTCAFALAVLVIVFHAQFDFMRRQELGINIDRSLVVKAPANVDSSYLRNLRAFKNELITLSVIENVTTSTEVPGNFIGNGWSGDVRRTPESESVICGVNLIDHDYISLYHLKLIVGRNFIPEDFPDTHFGNKVEPVILNRMAANRLGFIKPDEAIDQKIQWGKNTCRVVGVLEDFHHRSVKEPIAPILFTANIGPAITLKLTAESEKDLSHVIKLIHKKWNNFFPANAFEYFLLKDHFNEQYTDDERVARMFDLFCGLSLGVSFLGLFALSLFSLRLRMKEISIRKALGASMNRLLMLLSGEYLVLILISIGFSVPLAWIVVRRWLNDFSMRVELSAWYFLVPVLAILVIVFTTLCWQVFRVERRCSIDLLKEE
ncbi:MAG TPA: ABC transporter permease [Cyclobacteriaceae bacterium]|nr:ABC transporter permease [Cyclobacteriaceae bacterium]